MTKNLKIISGKYRGLMFSGDEIIGTRPTMNRVKESLFGMIQNNLKESVCLDLFAGSGNLGLEALSNGAECCYFVDNNKIATNVIKNNINDLHIKENYYIMNKDYNAALLYFKSNDIKFDIIFLDPPYQLYLINDCVNKIYDYNLLNKDGIIICESETEVINNLNFNVLKERTYGNKKITILRK